MTVFGLLRRSEGSLSEAGVEYPDFDAAQLVMFALGLSKDRLLLSYPDPVGEDDVRKCGELVSRRSDGEPLQYILGSWEFYGLQFFVGPGVLVPRQETEHLVSAALEHIEKNGLAAPLVWDLCAGSGAVGLSVAKNAPGASVVLFEKYPEAAAWCEKSRAFLGINNARTVIRDVTEPFPDGLGTPDVLVSNPPYVRSANVALLGADTAFEPTQAFDGGDDGLFFYRAIADGCISRMRRGSFAAFECDDWQAPAVMELMANCGFSDFSDRPCPGGEDVHIVGGVRTG
ncbi:MAG: peptide chain release factor N(5)-glutamine methyltransferase [Clostridia bacterium]|nr:peptide chain release factor N(5)-glutamine methyltransferase [Clostridia bacterium]